MYRYAYNFVSDSYISVCTDIHLHKHIIVTYMTVYRCVYGRCYPLCAQGIYIHIDLYMEDVIPNVHKASIYM